MIREALTDLAELARELVAADAVTILLLDGSEVTAGAPGPEPAAVELAVPGPDEPLAVVRVFGGRGALPTPAGPTLRHVAALVGAAVRAEAAPAAQQRAARILTHDLRSPLTTVLGFTGLLTMSAEHERQRDPTLTAASRAVAIAGHDLLLTVDALALQALPSGEDRVRVRLDELVADALTRAAPPGLDLPRLSRCDDVVVTTRRREAAGRLRLLLGLFVDRTSSGAPASVAVTASADGPGWRVELSGTAPPAADGPGRAVAERVAAACGAVLALPLGETGDPGDMVVASPLDAPRPELPGALPPAPRR